MRSIPDPSSLRFCPGTPDSGAPVRFFPTRRRGEEFPGNPRRRCSRDGSEPFDREPAPPIRSSALKPRPSDLDPTARICAYPFGPALFLKRPSSFAKSTRSPGLFKSNYAEVLILTRSPLSFTRFKLAVQPWFFYELDPRVNVYLRLGSQF